MAELVNRHYQEFLEKSEGLSPEELKEFISTHYGGEFKDERTGTVYMHGFFRSRNPGEVRFYADDPSALGVFTFDELKHIRPFRRKKSPASTPR